MSCRVGPAWRRHLGFILPAWLALALPATVAAVPGFDYANYRPWEARIPARTTTIGFGTWDRFAVLVDGDGTIEVHDISSIAQPRLVWSGFGFWRVEHVAMSGRYLLVGGYDYGGGVTQARLYELRGDGALACRGDWIPRGPGGHYYTPRGLAMWGDLCFFGGYRDFGVYPNVFVSRVSSGWAVDLGLVQGPGWPVAMAMKDNRLFVSSASLDIGWLDFSPEGTVLGSGSLALGAGCRALCMFGDHLLAAEPGGMLDVVKAVVSGTPGTVSRTALGGAPAAVAVDGGVALLADAYLGVRRVDLSDLEAPVVVDTLFAPGGATHVAAAGGHVLAASRSDGVVIIDPHVRCDSPLRFSVPWITGNFACHESVAFGAGVVDGQKCAVLVDLSAAGGPRLLHSLPLDYLDGTWVALSDCFAIIGVASGSSAGSLLLRWDPTNGFTGSVMLVGAPTSGAIRGNRIYLCSRYTWGGNIGVWEAQDFPVLRSLRQFEVSFQPLGLALAGDVLWCAGMSGGAGLLSAYDLEDPASPVFRGSTKVPHEIYGIDVEGDVLCGWGFSYSDAAYLYDVSRPNAVTVLSHLPTQGGALRARLAGPHAYVTTRSGLAVISIEDPRSPRALGMAVGPMLYLALAPDAVLAGSAAGVVGLALQTAGAASGVPAPAVLGPALKAWPSPFNPRLAIELTVAVAGDVTVEIFDVRGRRVAVPFHGTAGLGPLKLTWDGCTGSGPPAPSGTYFVRARDGAGATTRKVVLAR